MDNATAPRAIDPNRFREVLGSYPTGVAVVTAMDAQGAPIGMVVGTFTSVSLEPPLVAFLPMKSSRTFDLMRKSPSFCINVLAADQEPICRKLAAPGENKFASIPWHASPAGNPVIDGVVSWIDCTYDNIIEAGDHYIVLGAVLDMNLERNTTPLLFFQRGYGGFSTGPLVAAAERDTLQAVGLAEAVREEIETLAARLSAECALLASTGRDSVYVAVANYSLNRRGSSRLGFHVPIVPPMGALFVGQPGSPDDETWLSRLGRCDESVREAARERLARVRERGWSICLCNGHEKADLEEGIELYTNPHRTPEQERRLLALVQATSALHEPAEILDDQRYDVLHISAPVHDADGQVALVVRLSELPRGMDGRLIRDCAKRLQETAAAIGRRITPLRRKAAGG
jgi:flavin reductase (DIM6/NTAB) family NADH-FMN oxidoreductase RutF/DNA-binding IclR family transcriptional regulator